MNLFLRCHNLDPAFVVMGPRVGHNLTTVQQIMGSHLYANNDCLPCYLDSTLGSFFVWSCHRSRGEKSWRQFEPSRAIATPCGPGVRSASSNKKEGGGILISLLVEIASVWYLKSTYSTTPSLLKMYVYIEKCCGRKHVIHLIENFLCLKKKLKILVMSLNRFDFFRASIIVGYKPAKC